MLDEDRFRKNLDLMHEQLIAKGYQRAIEDVRTCTEYPHKPTDLKASMVLMKCPERACYTIYVQTNKVDKLSEKMFEKDIPFEELMKYSVREIMDRYFAVFVLDSILDNTESKISITKITEYLDGNKPTA